MAPQPLMRPELPSGTVTFLFTDVEGSTKLLHELGAEGYAMALAEHRQVIREASVRNSGVEVDTQGDAFFFAFPAASGAIEAAGEMTEALATGPIQVRIGLHTGSPLLTDEGYIGDDVHFGARLAGSGHGGQVLLSALTAAAIEPSNRLLQGTSLVDLGEHRLKDIESAVSIFQLGDDSFPPLKTISNTNLPRPASSFVGREQELGEVLARIEAGARLATLTGPGGSGKTRLALEAAASLVPEYKAGVFWVGLASLRDPALVTETISQTLGAKDGLAEHIGEREMLLLLDNLEQVIEAAPELSALLSACPNLTLLVTSRELLRVQGEVEYPVPPLAEPEAVSLFCERAQLQPTDDIAELCARLDNLPLAVELAAARVKALSPAQILERLSSRLDLLRGGRDSDPRQQTLRATIGWSYDLFSPEEQRLFARLSVFSGGCALEAAQEVADADLDTLQSLVEKSLLRFTNERYWMLETIREYAAERLEERDEAVALRRRYASWYANLAERSEPEWLGGDAPKWFGRVANELGNLRSAVDWGLAYDGVVALSIVANTWFFWTQTGRALEQRRLLEAAWTDNASVDLKLRALRAITAAALAQNDLGAVVRVSHERLELARGVDDLDQQAAAMGMLGAAFDSAGDIATARKWYEGAIELDRARSQFSASLGNLGRTERNDGNFARSRELLEEYLVTGRSASAEIDVAWAVKELGLTAIDEGAFADARALLKEGFEITSRLGLTTTAADLIFAVASLACATGKPREAALLLGAMDVQNEREGFEILPTTSWWWQLRAKLVAALGDPEFEALMAEGRSLDLEVAVAHAVACLD